MRDAWEELDRSLDEARKRDAADAAAKAAIRTPQEVRALARRLIEEPSDDR